MMIKPVNFGLSGGIILSITIFLITVLSILTGYDYGVDFLKVIMSLYPGFTISWTGSLIGLVYGFLDGFLALFVFAWIYNKL